MKPAPDAQDPLTRLDQLVGATPNYDIAWAGSDVFELAGLASTAYFALRRSRYLSTAAAATATLLVVDAWLDCMTTPTNERWERGRGRGRHPGFPQRRA